MNLSRPFRIQRPEPSAVETPPEAPLGNSFEDPPGNPSGRPLRNLLRRHPLGNSPKHPLGRPSSKPPSKTPFGTNLLRKNPSTASPQHPSRRPFREPPSGRATSEHPLSKPFGERRVSRNPFRSRRKALPEDPFEAPSKHPFGNLRSMTLVPKASPKASFGTCHPETPFRTHLRSTTHVSECAASLPEAPECTMKPSERNYHGSLRMRHVSPEESECAVSKTSSGCLRARHLSPGAFLFQPNFIKYTGNSQNF